MGVLSSVGFSLIYTKLAGYGCVIVGWFLTNLYQTRGLWVCYRRLVSHESIPNSRVMGVLSSVGFSLIYTKLAGYGCVIVGWFLTNLYQTHGLWVCYRRLVSHESIPNSRVMGVLSSVGFSLIYAKLAGYGCVIVGWFLTNLYQTHGLWVCYRRLVSH